jgi:cadmium resistance protein CadD (predicted permease)
MTEKPSNNDKASTFLLMFFGTMFSISAALSVYYYLEFSAETSVAIFLGGEILIPLLGYKIIYARSNDDCSSPNELSTSTDTETDDEPTSEDG